MTEVPGKELVSIEGMDSLTTFTTPGAMEPILAKIRDVIDKFTPDMTTEKGRKEIAAIAYRVVRAKTYLDGEGKKLNDAQKEIPKKIDATRKHIRDTLDAWAAEVRAPLTEWEEAEKARISNHKAALDHWQGLVERTGPSSAEIKQSLMLAMDIPIGEECEEFAVDYMRIKLDAVNKLQAAYDARIEWEADQAELARLRAEEEARKAEEKARVDEDERRGQEKREAAEAAARADKAIKDAEERLRQEAEKRAASKRHRAKVEKAAIEALVAGGVEEVVARQVIGLVSIGKIPQVRIDY